MVVQDKARRTFQIVVAATKQWGIGKGECLLGDAAPGGERDCPAAAWPGS